MMNYRQDSQEMIEALISVLMLVGTYSSAIFIFASKRFDSFMKGLTLKLTIIGIYIGLFAVFGYVTTVKLDRPFLIPV